MGLESGDPSYGHSFSSNQLCNLVQFTAHLPSERQAWLLSGFSLQPERRGLGACPLPGSIELRQRSGCRSVTPLPPLFRPRELCAPGQLEEKAKRRGAHAVLNHFSHAWLFAAPRTAARQLLHPWGPSRQEHWSGLPCPPPGDLSTQGSNPGLWRRGQILYRLSHQGSPPHI